MQNIPRYPAKPQRKTGRPTVFKNLFARIVELSQEVGYTERQAVVRSYGDPRKKQSIWRAVHNLQKQGLIRIIGRKLITPVRDPKSPSRYRLASTVEDLLCFAYVPDDEVDPNYVEEVRFLRLIHSFGVAEKHQIEQATGRKASCVVGDLRTAGYDIRKHCDAYTLHNIRLFEYDHGEFGENRKLGCPDPEVFVDVTTRLVDSSDFVVMKYPEDPLIVLHREAFTPLEVLEIERHPQYRDLDHMSIDYKPEYVNIPRIHNLLEAKFGADVMDRYPVVIDDDF